MIDTGPLVLDIGLVLLLAAGLGWVARHAGLPAVLGYLVAGLAVSPFTPGYVADREQISLLADIGVILLLFEVGIEVDLPALSRAQRPLFWLAPVQVLATTALGAAVLLAIGLPPFAALLLALGIAMSSSVVIVNITRSRRRTTNPVTERALLGWSALQDVTGVSLAAVVLAVFSSADRPLAIALTGLVLFGVLVVVVARVLPPLLRRLDAERDLFLLVSVAVGLTVAAVGAVAFGIPMALAAFIAGLAVSEGRETAEVRRVILPFRDVFAVLFFVAVGSLIDPSAAAAYLPFTGLLLALVLLAKVVPAYALARLGRLPARPGQLAVGLGQVGEFSYVLGASALAAGAITTSQFSGVLGAVAASIAASAVIVRQLGRRREAEVAAD